MEVLALEGPGGTSSALDSLAYIDPLTDAEREAAESMIQEEMQRAKRTGKRPNEYIAHLRPASGFLAFKVRPCTTVGPRDQQPNAVARRTSKPPSMHSDGNVSILACASDLLATNSDGIWLQDHPILQGEMARIQKGQKHMQPMDTSRSNLETPRLHDQQNLSAWQASASNAAAQLEHQHNRCELAAC
jgi:Breast carcinoma amplified sequence 2 (BCAS2)